MRIIKSGNGEKVPETPCTCQYCKCQFYFRRDEARIVDEPAEQESDRKFGVEDGYKPGWTEDT